MLLSYFNVFVSNNIYIYISHYNKLVFYCYSYKIAVVGDVRQERIYY